MPTNYIYFVEGQCEEVLLNALKEHPAKIMPGKVKVFNVIQNLIPRSILVAISQRTTVVFAFDTDVPITDNLKKNIEQIKKYCQTVKIVYLPQVLRLEDELVRCTDINRISELTRSRTESEFKRDFCKLSNCRDILEHHHMNVSQMWTQTVPEEFDFIEVNSNKIKI